MKIKVGYVVYFVALLHTLVHLYVYNNLEYHRDELLYFSLGLHPDLGYATVPPLIGWIAAVMQFLLGYSLLAVKLFPALLGGLLVIVSARIAKELGGGNYAQIITAIAILVLPAGLRAFHLFQPVPIDLFLWTLLFYYTLRYVNTSHNYYLIILGGVAGLALLNKYLILLLFVSLAVSLLLSPHRQLFKNRYLYLGALLALILFLPNLLWQIKYDFPVFGHMEALREDQLVYVDRVGFLMDQVFMTFSVVVLVIPGFYFLLRNRWYRYLGLSALLVVFVLLLLQGKSYYTMGIFPVLIAAGSVAVERFSQRLIYRLAIPVLMIALTLPILPMGMPIYDQQGLVNYFDRLEKEYGLVIGRRFEDGTIHSLPQDYADQLGWEELTRITSRAYDMVEDKEKALIYAENYGQAGAIAVIGKRYGLPEPVSFHESFYYWAPERFDPDITHFIYINDELGEEVSALFEDIRLVGAISNVNAREYGTSVYLCSKPRGSFNRAWQQILPLIEDPF